MPLLQLTYHSIPDASCDAAEVMRIVRTARANNPERGLTGYLLYRPGRFLQVLEGQTAVVTETFAHICRDPRHHSVALIGAQPIARRAFRRWSMGYVSIHQELLEAQEASGFAAAQADHTAVVGYIERLARRVAA